MSNRVSKLGFSFGVIVSFFRGTRQGTGGVFVGG